MEMIERDTPMKGNHTEPRICTMVGRDPNNPKSRKKSDGYVQMLEIGDDVSNTLTSVQKDNFVAEPVAQEPYNADEDGCAKDILAGCYKFGAATLLRKSGATMTSVIEGVSVHTNSRALEFKGKKSIKTDASPALRATDYKAPHCVWENSANYRIRKLTPRECFRLMGVSESDIEKIQNSGVSQSQQYKMAGNSIVVDVLEHIFRKMFVDTIQESQQLSLF